MRLRQIIAPSPGKFLLLTLASSLLLAPELPAYALEGAAPKFLQRQDNAPIAPQILLLRRAIIGQESSANFRAINPHSGALGYAQIMPANLPSWSREALGYSVSRDEFLNNPSLQLAIIDYKLNQYWQQSLWVSNGNEDLAILRVASWWYSGKPDRYSSTQPQYYNGHRYPSIAEYSQSVWRRYQTFAAEQNNTALGPEQSSGRSIANPALNPLIPALRPFQPALNSNSSSLNPVQRLVPHS